MLQLTIHMENPVGSDILQFIKRNVSPFGVLPITAEDGKAKDEIVTIVLSNEPVAAADEKWRWMSLSLMGVFSVW